MRVLNSLTEKWWSSLWLVQATLFVGPILAHCLPVNPVSVCIYGFNLMLKVMFLCTKRKHNTLQGLVWALSSCLDLIGHGLVVRCCSAVHLLMQAIHLLAIILDVAIIWFKVSIKEYLIQSKNPSIIQFPNSQTILVSITSEVLRFIPVPIILHKSAFTICSNKHHMRISIFKSDLRWQRNVFKRSMCPAIKL